MGPRTAVSLAALAAAAVLAATAAAGPSVAGNPARGKALFSRPGVFCGSCHTLKAAKSNGRDGPDLDRAKPSYDRIVEIVSKGSEASRRWPTGMPKYAGKKGTYGVLPKTQIQDLAAFVYSATHK
jgi:mono/diheme cytochrome c family protein